MRMQVLSRIVSSARAMPILASALVSVAFCIGSAAAAGPETALRSRANQEPAVAGRALAAAEPTRSIDAVRARIEGFSEPEAKRFYLGCSGAAIRQHLDRAGVAACSIGYDVLLRHHFGGDFDALLAWSRRQRHDELASADLDRPHAED